MNNLTDPHLKHLLSQATPGPWEYDPGEQEDERCIIDAETWNMCINPTSNGEGSSCSDAELYLAALAPELAQEVIQLRDALSHLIEEALKIGYSSENAATIKHIAEAIKTALEKARGEHDE